MKLKCMRPYTTQNGKELLCVFYKVIDAMKKTIKVVAAEHTTYREFVWCYITKPQYADLVLTKFRATVKLRAAVEQMAIKSKTQKVTTTTVDTESISVSYKDKYERPYTIDPKTNTVVYQFPKVLKKTIVTEESQKIVWLNSNGESGRLIKIATTDDLVAKDGVIGNVPGDRECGVYNFENCPASQTAFVTRPEDVYTFLDELKLSQYQVWSCLTNTKSISIPSYDIDFATSTSDVDKRQSWPYFINCDDNGEIRLYVDTFETRGASSSKTSLIHFKRYYKDLGCIKYKSSMMVKRKNKVNTICGTFDCVEEVNSYNGCVLLGEIDTKKTFGDQYLSDGSIIIYCREGRIDSDDLIKIKAILN